MRARILAKLQREPIFAYIQTISQWMKFSMTFGSVTNFGEDKANFEDGSGFAPSLITDSGE